MYKLPLATLKLIGDYSAIANNVNELESRCHFIRLMG